MKTMTRAESPTTKTMTPLDYGTSTLRTLASDGKPVRWQVYIDGEVKFELCVVS